MTCERSGAVSCVARKTRVDVVMVLPALLNAAGTVDVDQWGPDLTLSVSLNTDISLSTPHPVLGVNVSIKDCMCSRRARCVQQVSEHSPKSCGQQSRDSKRTERRSCTGYAEARCRSSKAWQLHLSV